MLASGDLPRHADEARELAIEIVLRPPVPLRARPLLELVNHITVGLLPAEIRRGYGFSWDPARALALHGGAEYVRRVMLPLLPRRLRLRAALTLNQGSGGVFTRWLRVPSGRAPRAPAAPPCAPAAIAPVRSTPRRSVSRPCMRRAEAVAARTSCGS